MEANATPPRKKVLKSILNRPEWASKKLAKPLQDPESDPFNRKKETLALHKQQLQLEAEGKERKETLRHEEEEESTNATSRRRKKRRLNSEESNGGSDSGIEGSEARLEKGRSKSPSFTVGKAGRDNVQEQSSDGAGLQTIDNEDEMDEPSPHIQPVESYTDDEDLYSKPIAIKAQICDPLKPPAWPVKRASPTPPPPSPEKARQPTAEESLVNNYPIRIFISSRIPGTEPLIVARKLGQRLKEVRLAWLRRQACIPADQARNVFLTWRGHRIYDFSMCKNLGIKLDDVGRLWWEGRDEAMGDEGDEQSHIAFEAVTNEIFEEDRRRKAVQENKALAVADGITVNGQEDATPSEMPDDGSIRIIVRGGTKTLKEYKLKVKPTTKIQQIVLAFRKYNSIDTSRGIYLTFDGERLDPEAEMRSLEDFEQGDYLDAIVKD